MIKTILKVAGIILAVLVLAVIGLVVYILVNNYRYEEAKKKVNISVFYNPERCSKEYPMGVLIENGGDRTIHDTSFDISIKREGHSSKLTSYVPSYTTDKIIKPGEKYGACWTYPELKKEHRGKYDAKDLIYSIGYKSIIFGD